MLKPIVRKSYRTVFLIGLIIALALSANVALAAHQLTEEGSGDLEFQPGEGAGNATASAEFEVSQEQGQTKITINPDTGIFENLEDHEMWLLDEDGDRRVSVGRLDEVPDEGFSTSVDNIEDFDSIIISRQSPDDDEQVTFTADLPHE